MATLLQTWFVFFPIYPDRELGLVQLSLNLLWTAEKSSRWMKIVDAAWRLFVEDECCDSVFKISFEIRKRMRPAAPNRIQSDLVVALLPCAVGISCWSGTPGDPKGPTPGCWKISPWRPTSIRDLLA